MELAAGPIAMLTVDHARANGLVVDGSGDRQVLALGVGIDLAARLSPHWRLSLGVEGFRAALGPDYFVEIEGAKMVVLHPYTWEAITSTKVEFVVWP